ncbi:MAG: M23/M56 family metallopeptidase [Chloroflexota bacterium]|nr:M23/M56 family metallopeptidase [Chloroflexota bacterium]
MIVNNLIMTWTSISPAVISWLMTFVIHSTILCGMAWLITHYAHSYRLKELLWKTALVGGMLTTTLQTSWGIGPMVEPAGLRGKNADTIISPNEANLEPQMMIASGKDEQALESAPYPAVTLLDRLGATLHNGAGWLVGLWLLGATAAGLRLDIVTRRLYASFGQRHTLPDGPVTDLLAQLGTVVGVHHRVRLTSSSRISSPMVLGANEICLPQRAITDLGIEQQKCLLGHELAHVMRRDPLWLMVGGVLECVFFFQPLIRLGRRRMQECAECLCDDMAAHYTGNGLEVAKCLVTVAGWGRSCAQPVAVISMARNISGLERRVRRLLNGPWNVQAETPRWWWACLAIGILVVGCAGPRVSVQSDDALVIGGERNTLVWPVEGHIAQSYSPEHRALDIAAEEGTPIVAAADGVVTTAQWDSDGRGNMVIIDHGDGWSTLCSHMADYQVAEGDEVTAGQVIGTVGSTGWSTGPHLHFELWHDTEPVSPLEDFYVQ